MVPGIKVDASKIPLTGAPGDEITEGLDGLAKRIDAYRRQGAHFAKWRAVYNVSDTLPSRLAVEANAESLARYAAICQECGIVPIVEPEVLIDGDHSMARCAEVTEAVLHEVFHALQGRARAHAAEAEHGAAWQGERATGLAGRGCSPDNPDPAAHRACGGC